MNKEQAAFDTFSILFLLTMILYYVFSMFYYCTTYFTTILNINLAKVVHTIIQLLVFGDHCIV